MGKPLACIFSEDRAICCAGPPWRLWYGAVECAELGEATMCHAHLDYLETAWQVGQQITGVFRDGQQYPLADYVAVEGAGVRQRWAGPR